MSSKEALRHIRHIRKHLHHHGHHDHVKLCDMMTSHLKGGGNLEGSGIMDVIKHYAGVLGDYFKPKGKSDLESFHSHISGLKPEWESAEKARKKKASDTTWNNMMGLFGQKRADEAGDAYQRAIGNSGHLAHSASNFADAARRLRDRY